MQDAASAMSFPSFPDSSMQDAASAKSSPSFPEQESGSPMPILECCTSTLHDAPPPVTSMPTEDHRTETFLPPPVQDLLRRILEHEELERKWAIECQVEGDIDSTALLNLAKERVRNSQDASNVGHLHAMSVALNNLYHLRLELANWRISGMKMVLPNSSASRPVGSGDFKLSSVQVASQTWALIVGINAYSQVPLFGCVADAMMMKGCLIDDVGVPESRIQLLLADHGDSPNHPNYASRANIIEKLHSLRYNPQIRKGDNIIVFFSGHGSRYDCSEIYPTVVNGADHLGSIDAFCPADSGQYMNNHCIPNISDREINTIISLIRDAKGSNITFIADCCHAGGITRNVPISGTIRVMPTPNGKEGASQLQYMLQVGEECLRRRAPGVPSVLAGGWKADMSSHVLLAACEDYQFAMEVRKPDGRVNGVFTEALVCALQSGLNMSTTYVGLGSIIARTTLPIQAPTVVGQKKQNLLWYRSS